MSAGDVIAQIWLEKKGWDTFEYSRTARFAFLGCCFVGPMIRTWYVRLERFMGSSVTLLTTIKKVALDQFGFAPIFTVGILGSIGLLQGLDVQGVKEKLDREFVDVMLTGWKVILQNQSLFLQW